MSRRSANDARKFRAELEERIQREYEAGGHKLGWKFLYGPEAVLDGARVALVGLNPGGNFVPSEIADFANNEGSSYVVERWAGAPAGQYKLQLQVRALFRQVGESPDKVLAGNLVPFRSPSWADLRNRQSALAFGKRLWRDILTDVKPEMVIAMGGETASALKDVLGVRRAERIPVGWGTIAGERGPYDGGVFVGLPHLSRFAIMTRRESQAGLAQLLRR